MLEQRNEALKRSNHPEFTVRSMDDHRQRAVL